MDRISRVVTLVLLGIELTFAGSCASTSGQVTPSDPGVQRGAWIANLHERLSANLCADDQMFRLCYRISSTECRLRARETARLCEMQVAGALPRTLNDAQGKEWGGRIGACTGESLFQFLDSAATYHETPGCREILSRN